MPDSNQNSTTLKRRTHRITNGTKNFLHRKNSTKKMRSKNIYYLIKENQVQNISTNFTDCICNKDFFQKTISSKKEHIKKTSRIHKIFLCISLLFYKNYEWNKSVFLRRVIKAYKAKASVQRWKSPRKLFVLWRNRRNWVKKMRKKEY